MSLSEIAAATGGRLLVGRGESLLPEISTDSRHIKPGQVFLPIRGERFRGQAFIEEALRRGAAGFFTEEWNDQLDVLARGAGSPVVVMRVADGNRALTDLAALARRKMDAKVIGITGSTGKTSTKHLLAAALGMDKRVYVSPANYNNEVGAPLTILQAPADVQCLVLEMGMRGVGQIAELAEMARPDIGIVTNVGQAHVGVLGSKERIAEAKSELVAALPPSGVAIINSDDDFAPFLAARSRGAVLTFGMHASADFRATDIHLDAKARARFVIHTPTDKGEVRLRVCGRHWVANALAAAAAASAAGVSLASIEKGLASADAPAMRMECTSVSGITILNDAYNANPVSMEAALTALGDMETSGKRLAILGDMAELGDEAEQAHSDIGAVVARSGVDTLVAVGPMSRIIVDSAVKAGMPREETHWFGLLGDSVSCVRSLAEPGDLVLIKASRAMGLDKLADMLAK